MFQVETKFSTLSTKHLYSWNKLKQASKHLINIFGVVLDMIRPCLFPAKSASVH